MVIRLDKFINLWYIRNMLILQILGDWLQPTDNFVMVEKPDDFVLEDTNYKIVTEQEYQNFQEHKNDRHSSPTNRRGCRHF